MTIDRLTARGAARASTAHDEHNFGQLVRQANPGATRRADVQRQAAEARRAVQEQAAQALASQRELQEQAALEREQRQAQRPQMPQQMPNTPRLS